MPIPLASPAATVADFRTAQLSFPEPLTPAHRFLIRGSDFETDGRLFIGLEAGPEQG